MEDLTANNPLSERRYNGEPCKKGHGTVRYNSNGACVVCSNERARTLLRKPKWREKRREYGRSLQGRATPYGLNGEQLQAIIDIQGGKCGICEKELNTIRWTVDHNHKCCPDKPACGKCVRGVLCYNYNTALGLLNDSPVLFEKAAVYSVSSLPESILSKGTSRKNLGADVVLPPKLRHTRPRNKLSISDVVEIRRLEESGESKQTIAAQFNITTHQVMNIVKRRAWASVP